MHHIIAYSSENKDFLEDKEQIRHKSASVVGRRSWGIYLNCDNRMAKLVAMPRKSNVSTLSISHSIFCVYLMFNGETLVANTILRLK